MATISMSLDPHGIATAAKELEKYARYLERATSEIDLRMSQEAAAEASAHFDEGVTVTAMDHGVVAAGESVVFQEFGAGARISDPYPDGADADIEIRRGAYSDLNGGEYAETGYQFWHHDGERYEYVTPVNGLFHGMMVAREKAAEIAREVIQNPW